jgi:hypothetical protein
MNHGSMGWTDAHRASKAPLWAILRASGQSSWLPTAPFLTDCDVRK